MVERSASRHGDVTASRLRRSGAPALVLAWLVALACSAETETERGAPTGSDAGSEAAAAGSEAAAAGSEAATGGAEDGAELGDNDPGPNVSVGGAAGGAAGGAGPDTQLAGAGGDSASTVVGVCGDRVVTPDETCDDGNQIPFDGCGSTCQREPQCSRAGCTSTCGDGLVIDEECDDGNARDGDGCSATCRVEPGSSCEPEEECDELNGSCVLRTSAIYRDFSSAHPDFEAACRGQSGGSEATKGLLEERLADGVPVARSVSAAACITRLSDWYSDAGGKAIVRDLTLFPNGRGAFVNRYGAAGEQWQTQAVYSARWCGNGDTGCAASGDFPGCDFDPTVESCFYPCPIGSGSELDTCAGTIFTPSAAFDGTPVFFPVDDQPMVETWSDAKVPPEYGYPWVFEDTVVPTVGALHEHGRLAHNFYFTSRLASWFRYDASDVIELDFLGDDDLWVFVNEQLALDLGGVHYAVKDRLVIDATAATTLGLEDGKVYRIDIFHAERKRDSSSLLVTLPGFNSSRSQCRKL